MVTAVNRQPLGEQIQETVFHDYFSVSLCQKARGGDTLESLERQFNLSTGKRGPGRARVGMVILYYVQFLKLHIKFTFDLCLPGKLWVKSRPLLIQCEVLEFQSAFWGSGH